MTQVVTAPPAQSNGAVAKTQNIVDQTLARVNEMQETGGIQIPKDYSAANALKSAWLVLQDVKNRDNVPVLEVCDKASVANALLKMVVQGLNPMKRQCSFIAYGKTLLCQREYQGSIAVAKRYGLKSVVANAIFEGDEFAFEIEPETGRRKIVKHIPTIDSFGGTVKGAYAIIEMQDGTKNVEIMTMRQIQAAWNQGPTKGQSPAHKNFPDQMACKTVINRAVKTIINSSDDADLFDDETPTESPAIADAKRTIADNANGVAEGAGNVGFDDDDQATNTTQQQEQEPEIPAAENKPAQPAQQATNGRIPF